jgi:hypothetical protein
MTQAIETEKEGQTGVEENTNPLKILPVRNGNS